MKVEAITSDHISLFKAQAYEKTRGLGLDDSTRDDVAMLMAEDFHRAYRKGRADFNQQFSLWGALKKLHVSGKGWDVLHRKQDCLDLDSPMENGDTLADSLAGPNGVHWKPNILDVCEQLDKRLTARQQVVLEMRLMECSVFEIAAAVGLSVVGTYTEFRRIWKVAKQMEGQL